MNGVLFIIPEYVGNPVLGVAVATAFSRLLGCTLVNCADTNFPSIQALLQAELEEIYQVSTLGIPTAGEQISYNFAQTFTTAFIAMLGTQVIAAKSVSLF